MKSKYLKRAVEHVAKEPYKNEIPAPVYIVYGFFSLFGVYSLIALLRLLCRVREVAAAEPCHTADVEGHDYSDLSP